MTVKMSYIQRNSKTCNGNVGGLEHQGRASGLGVSPFTGTLGPKYILLFGYRDP